MYSNNVDVDEMEDFLRDKGLTSEQLLKMREQKIEPTIILLMEDSQLAEFVPKLGHRIALREFCKLKSPTECSISTRKQSLLENLRQKLNSKGNLNKDEGHNRKPNRANTCSKAHDIKQIEVGWLCCLDDDSDQDDHKYRQVREISGGGTRKIKVPKEANKDYIIEKGIDLFFPKGESTKGHLDEFVVDLFDFKKHSIEKDVTVAEILEATGLNKLRFYLATKKKSQKKYVFTDDDDVTLVSVNMEKNHDCALEMDGEINEIKSNNDYLTLQTSNIQELHDAGLTMETDSESVYSMKSFNDLTFQTLNPQRFYNSEEPLCNFDNSCMEIYKLKKILVNMFLALNVIEDKTLCQEEVNILLTNTLNGSENASSIVNTLEVPSLTEQVEDSNETPSTLFDILSKLQRKINYNSINKFNVFRTDIFNCCIRAMRRKSFSPFNKISVKFSDSEGVTEGAIDEGGPTRELFRLVLSFLKNSQLFTGPVKKHISLNNNSLKDNLYYETGRLISLSLVHGGPGPHFFSETLFSILTTGIQNTLPTLDDVDTEIQNKLNLFKDTVDLLELQNIITSENIFAIAGCDYIKHVDEKWKIFDDTLKFYALKRIEEPLNQLIEGLKTCGIYEQIKTYPHLFKDVFCDDKRIVTSEVVEKLFDIEYSVAGSNRREIENRTISYFRDYILDCEENSADGDISEGNSENIDVTLSDILVFATGADSVPPLGFPVKPKITFLHENKSKFPIANTCALHLKLPTLHLQYDDFKLNMNFGIGNSKSFGFA